MSRHRTVDAGAERRARGRRARGRAATCTEGSWEYSACNATHDAVCKPCTQCEEGRTFALASCAPSADAVCAACANCTGYVSSTGGRNTFVSTFAAESCTPTQNAVCAPCSQCHAWQYTESECTGDTDTKCSHRCGFDPNPMWNEEAMNSPDVQKFVWNELLYAGDGIGGLCRPVTPSCGTGEYQEAGPSPTADRICKEVTRCVLGQSFEVFAPTNISDRVCKPTQLCTLEQFEAVVPTFSSDRVCQFSSTCLTGQYDAADRGTVLPGFNFHKIDRECRWKTFCNSSKILNLKAY